MKISATLQKIIPTLLTIVTGKTRHKVDDIAWSKDSVTYNLFRLWELICWRRSGSTNNPRDTIRIESKAEYVEDENGVHLTYKFYTFEAIFVNVEVALVSYLKNVTRKIKSVSWNFDIVNIFQPQFAFEGFWTESANEETPRGYVFSIAADTSTSLGNQPGSSFSFSYTVTGSNPLLTTGVQFTDGTITESSSTYNAVSLTSIAGKNTPNNSRRVELWYLLGAATGSHTLAASFSNSPTNWWSVGVSSFSGVKQSAQPDASGSSSADSGITDLTKAIVTIADNCWLVGICCNGASSNPVADSGTTLRQSMYNRTGNGYEGFLLDSNAAKTPAGSYALGVSATSGGGTIVVASFSPLTIQTLTLLAGTGTFTLTGIAILLTRIAHLFAAVASFVMTGNSINFSLRRGWKNVTKTSSSATNVTKTNSTFTNTTK